MQINDNQTNQKDPDNRGHNELENIDPELCSIWLGRRDSNPRMPGPKPGALPLGDAPIATTCWLMCKRLSCNLLLSA